MPLLGRKICYLDRTIERTGFLLYVHKNAWNVHILHTEHEKLYSTGNVLKGTGKLMYVQEKNCTVQNISEENKNMHSTVKIVKWAGKILSVQKKLCTYRKKSVLYRVFLKIDFWPNLRLTVLIVLVLTKKACTDCEAFQSYPTYKKNNAYPLFNLEFAMY